MRRKTHQTSRLDVRPLRMNDYAAWFDAYVFGKKKLNEWDRDPIKKEKCSQKVFKEIVLRHRELARTDKCYIYGLFWKRVLVGFIDIAIHDRDCKQFANLGYFLFNRYWGIGLGSEAMQAALAIGLIDLKLQRLEASIDLHNRRSIKLVKKFGLEREGIKKKYWFQNGKWDDQVIYVARPEHL